MKLKHKDIIFDLEVKRENDILSLIEENITNFNIKNLNENSISVNSLSGKKTAFFHKNKNSITVNIEGHNYYFELIEDDLFADTSSVADKNIDIIKSPMPGSVIKILVSEGDLVEEGSALIIVEAMKMETTLYSSIDGKVAEINTKNGEQVAPDKELIKIEKITD